MNISTKVEYSDQMIYPTKKRKQLKNYKEILNYYKLALIALYTYLTNGTVSYPSL